MDHAMTWLFLRMVLLITVVFLLANGAKAKRKDDVVTMKNGNSFTGEIKELEHGELVFKSEYMKDSVHLDWKQVRSLRSKDVFIVSLNDGRRLSIGRGHHQRAVGGVCDRADGLLGHRDQPSGAGIRAHRH